MAMSAVGRIPAGELLGFVLYTRERKGQQWLIQLWVVCSHCNVGAVLLRHLMTLQPHPTCFTVRALSPVVGFYEKLGFRRLCSTNGVGPSGEVFLFTKTKDPPPTLLTQPS